MTQSIDFICVLPNGIHARPASQIEALCNKFSSSIEWRNLANNSQGDAKSALSIIGTNTVKDHACQFIITGNDEKQAFEKLNAFIQNEFPYCDEVLPEVNNIEKNSIPQSLAHLNPTMFHGVPVCNNSANGVLVHLKPFNLHDFKDLPKTNEKKEEHKLFNDGLNLLIKHINLRILENNGTTNAVLEAHKSLANDLSLQQYIKENIDEGKSCAVSIIKACDYFSERFTNSESSYLQERALDIRDVCYQLLQHIYGENLFPTQGKLQQPSICMADELTPSQFLDLDKSLLKGLLLRSGGTTSHTVILARSFNVPTLVDVDIDILQPWINKIIQIDGNIGIILVDLNEAVQRYYKQEEFVQIKLQEQQKIWLTQEGRTSDGVRLEIAANIAHSIEAKTAFGNGAEAIGLFRTEMLYMDRNYPPTEDELYNIYCQALEAANGHTIIVRTIDIGGDKPVDYLNIPSENNPFLGYRAVRIYQEYIDIFHAQLRSILRASAHGSLKIMIPMVSSMEEILWVKEQLAAVKQTLRNEHVPFDEKILLGIMLEVPSVMFIIDQCCEEIDFFSIGSNDLTQYLLAVDRDNTKVSRHYNSLNPAFLRALDFAVQAVHRQGKWIGLCGELGAKGSVLPLLVGMGLDEISMSSPAILATKARLSNLDSRACRQLLNQAMTCRTSLEVEHLLAQFQMNKKEAPLITTECISLDNDWRSKEEVIKGMTDNLLLAGRCRYPRKLEQDIWTREAVFSTGLGFSFAIPHTKSEHIEQSTISIARLQDPVNWGGEENAQFVIMLTLNKHVAGDQHMRIFSRLARRIMHEEFRNSLINALDTETVAKLLKQELEL